MDVKLAYLHGVLEEEIYMEQPEGFIAKGEEDKVCRLDILALALPLLHWNHNRFGFHGPDINSFNRIASHMYKHQTLVLQELLLFLKISLFISVSQCFFSRIVDMMEERVVLKIVLYHLR